jgi:hypothetical protein
MLVAWLAVAGLAISTLVAERDLHLAVTVFAITFLLAAWGLFIAESASLLSSLLFSVPFLLAVVGRVVLPARDLRTTAT